MNAPTNSDQSNQSPPGPNPVTESADPGDQDIDTGATNAYDQFDSKRGKPLRGPRRDKTRSLAVGDAPDNTGKPIGLHDPSSMPRGEDDDAVRARSPEFHDRPGSGKYR